jgi:GntR family transcriptional repressor for pyruvate dehydrogenase complex
MAGTVMFTRVAREPRLSEKVARQILEAIVQSPLRPGDPLPSERTLGEQFGVSRTVIREALHSLAGKGIVDMSQGRGLRVARVDSSAVRESMRLFMRSRPALDYPRVHELRALLETEVAELAASRALEDDLTRLQGACEALVDVLDDPKAASQTDFEFHRVLAQCTHNELFVVVLDAINEPLMEIRLETFETVAHRAETALQAHRLICKAVHSHSPEEARAAMQEHLDDVLIVWRQVKALDDREIEPPGRMPTASQPAAQYAPETEAGASARRETSGNG